MLWSQVFFSSIPIPGVIATWVSGCISPRPVGDGVSGVGFFGLGAEGAMKKAYYHEVLQDEDLNYWFKAAKKPYPGHHPGEQFEPELMFSANENKFQLAFPKKKATSKAPDMDITDYNLPPIDL